MVRIHPGSLLSLNHSLDYRARVIILVSLSPSTGRPSFILLDFVVRCEQSSNTSASHESCILGEDVRTPANPKRVDTEAEVMDGKDAIVSVESMGGAVFPVLDSLVNIVFGQLASSCKLLTAEDLNLMNTRETVGTLALLYSTLCAVKESISSLFFPETYLRHGDSRDNESTPETCSKCC